MIFSSVHITRSRAQRDKQNMFHLNHTIEGRKSSEALEGENEGQKNGAKVNVGRFLTRGCDFSTPHLIF